MTNMIESKSRISSFGQYFVDFFLVFSLRGPSLHSLHPEPFFVSEIKVDSGTIETLSGKLILAPSTFVSMPQGGVACSRRAEARGAGDPAGLSRCSLVGYAAVCEM